MNTTWSVALMVLLCTGGIGAAGGQLARLEDQIEPEYREQPSLSARDMDDMAVAIIFSIRGGGMATADALQHELEDKLLNPVSSNPQKRRRVERAAFESLLHFVPTPTNIRDRYHGLYADISKVPFFAPKTSRGIQEFELLDSRLRTFLSLFNGASLRGKWFTKLYFDWLAAKNNPSFITDFVRRYKEFFRSDYDGRGNYGHAVTPAISADLYAFIDELVTDYHAKHAPSPVPKPAPLPRALDRLLAQPAPHVGPTHPAPSIAQPASVTRAPTAARVASGKMPPPKPMPAKGTPAARAAHAQQAKVQAAREQELRAQHEQAAAKQRAQAAAARERNIQDVKRMQAQAAQIDRALQTAMIRVGDRARKVWQASIAPSVGELVKAIRNYAVLYNRLVARGVRPAKTPDQIFKGILDSIYDPVVRAATHRAIRVGVAARK